MENFWHEFMVTAVITMIITASIIVVVTLMNYKPEDRKKSDFDVTVGE